ncbi:WSC domain-containing protein [Blastomyces dermatitidis ER-3]|uniref:WSC domain-containing protein n=1 Tax=Ajellomyces dermatitidis (strain ER-3 / ATCC MYA-2586) TaxID=559297 RepID=A0ABP2EP85_AJEDR|nr:WSC domain-containing protein [Blastomyces dermatitidis ER-3]EEQ84068.1 WSC domain-containing protein [Blastomyces dermatitidis ER-3]
MRLLVVLAATISPALAFWRLPCRGRVGLGPIDPIVNPGKRSGHVHALHGAGNLGLTNTYDELRASECTSCEVIEDMSLYWAPALYFEHPDKSTELVKQVGGMLVYYLQRHEPGEKVHAFPPGLRMLAGSNLQRNFTDAQKNIGFTCLNYDKHPEPYHIPHKLPDKNYIDTNCKHGIRSEIFFPSCWDGVRTDSPNHKDHMAYPSRIDNGFCPPGYPIRLVSIFFETIWDTSAYKGKAGRFVFSNGDPTGYGYHGDFMNGWDEKFLQKAVDECTSNSGTVQDCRQFTLQKDSVQNKCKMRTPPMLEGESFDRRANGLPENVPISDGPGYAKPGTPPSEDPDKPSPSQGYPQPSPTATTSSVEEAPSSFPTQPPPPVETEPPAGEDPDTNEPPADDKPGNEPPTDDKPGNEPPTDDELGNEPPEDDDSECEAPTDYPHSELPEPSQPPVVKPVDPQPTDGPLPSETEAPGYSIVDHPSGSQPQITDAPDGECPAGKVVAMSWSTNGNSVYKINYYEQFVVTTVTAAAAAAAAAETAAPEAGSRKRDHVRMHKRHAHRH